MKTKYLLTAALFLTLGMTAKAQENTNGTVTPGVVPPKAEKTANPAYREAQGTTPPTWERTRNPATGETPGQPAKQEEVITTGKMRNPNPEQ